LEIILLKSRHAGQRWNRKPVQLEPKADDTGASSAHFSAEFPLGEPPKIGIVLT
jgi:hypothetical protein